MITHINVLRKHGLGSFRDMLIDVSKDPAMLTFLDNKVNGNRVGGVVTINENYGRELIELYTVGEGNGYTQTDVVGSSECMSGWGLYGLQTFRFRRSMHLNGPKTVFGNIISNPQQPEYVMLYSEFGRRIGENGALGTEHGAGGVAFVAGRPVRGGLYGKYPDLSIYNQNVLAQQSIAFDSDSTDFREMYATVLDKWLQVSSANVLGSSFPHQNFL